MKKKTIRTIVVTILFSAAVILPGCEKLDCATCKLVTNNDGSITETPGLIYCGDKLAEKESSEPVTIGKITTYWDCE